MNRILTIEVSEGEHGDWDIKALSDKCLASASTLFWSMPNLTEQQVEFLAEYLVHRANEWMMGSRNSSKRRGWEK